MRNTMRRVASAALLMVCVLVVPAQAAIIPYGNIGIEAPAGPSYNVVHSGLVTATISYPADAAYTDRFGYRINNGPDILTGLQNHGSVGTSISFLANAGDRLTIFELNGVGETFYSDHSLNSDGLTHVYQQNYVAILGIPVPGGLYFGFEDLRDGGDFDYNDFSVVVANVASAVPEPSNWAMLLLGFMGLAYVVRNRRTNIRPV